MAARGGDNCLYGSVVGLDRVLEMDAAAYGGPNARTSPMACEECEEQRAELECEDCGLVYCVPCDAHRHRKGKLLFHQRTRLDITSALGEEQSSGGVHGWSVSAVADWLVAQNLEVFADPARMAGVDGNFLFSSRFDSFVDGVAAASRGHKKKLLREVQKLKEAEQGSMTSTATTVSSDGVARLNLRVDVASAVDTTAAQATNFSPVSALRSRIAHGQNGGDARGRVVRRRSAFTTAEEALPSLAQSRAGNAPPAGALGTEKRSRSMFLGAAPLKIDVASIPETSTAVRQPQRASPPSMDSLDVRPMRQALGGLDLDIGQVKREQNAMAASFDFTAEGRLQTQGFEINTQGIANAPFPTHLARKKVAMGTREYLLVLNELGHGAGGKVYKALYLPTFKFVAIKVIRVYDQQKRHQMVRELKSLYVNFVAITDADTQAAACEDLVVFYDAFTNPEAGTVSIVLEYMDGGSMEDCMQAGKCTTERELANLAYCGLKGLAFLHEHHQLHRDIKLSNMLINQQGQVKISDFGISRDLESTLAKANTFTGTLLYMAPERISGGMYSYPSDIWSFGLAVMACAIGKLPVPTKEGYWGVVHAVQSQPSPRLQDFGDSFSPELCDFLDKCLQKNPLMRPPAAELLRHPFILNNTSPRGEHRTHVIADDSATSTERRRKSLEDTAVKVEAWCKEHAETLLSPTSGMGTGDTPVFQQTPNSAKINALAHQLRLPVADVAARFAFLNRYTQ